MYRVALINMPFAALHLPSIALTQLAAAVDAALGERVEVRVLYLSHDLGHYLGQNLYRYVSSSLEANMCGLGDWFFKAAAFAGEPDDPEAFLRRFLPARAAEFAATTRLLLEKRRGLEGFLHRMVAKHRLLENDLVGFTSMFCQNAASFALARKLKQRRPELVTVMGGANCETPMGEEIVAHVEDIDFVFSGPALRSLPAFLAAQLDGDAERAGSINGVFSRGNAERRRTSELARIGDERPIEAPLPLDYGPFLAGLEASFGSSIEPTLTFETSRGCWWGERAHCTFCGLNGTTMAYRAMPAEAAVEQFARLFRHAPGCVRFESVDNIMPRSYLTDVLPRLSPPPGAVIFYEVKADLAREELEVMARAGVREIQPGIESLATSTLKLMKKGTSACGNVAFLRDCLACGIRPEWNLLVGFPGEGEEVYRKYLVDIPLLVHLPPPSGVFPVRFDRYSPYFVKAAEFGLDLRPNDFYASIYPFGEETLRNLAYYFVDRNHQAPYLTTLIEWSDAVAAVVDGWRARWSREGEGAPELSLVGERESLTAVRDSRGRTVVEYEISRAAVELLGWLREGKPFRAGDANAVWGPLSWLKDKALVFEEEGRYVSLVPVDSPNGPTR